MRVDVVHAVKCAYMYMYDRVSVFVIYSRLSESQAFDVQAVVDMLNRATNGTKAQFFWASRTASQRSCPHPSFLEMLHHKFG